MIDYLPDDDIDERRRRATARDRKCGSKLHNEERCGNLNEINAPHESIDTMELFMKYVRGAMKNGKLIILSTTIIISCLSLLYVLLATRQYSSTTYIYLDPRSAPAGAERQSVGDFAMASNLVESQAQLIGSERIAKAVIARLGLDQAAETTTPSVLSRLEHLVGLAPGGQDSGSGATRLVIENLRSRLTVKRQPMTFVIAISYVSRDPSTAKQISQAFADAYIDEQLNSTKQSNKLAGDWLQERLEDLREQARSADRALQDFRSTSVSADPVILNDLESRSQVARVTYESFLRRFTDIVQQQSFPMTDARIASDASIPEPTGPRKSFILLTATLLGALLGTGLSVLREIDREHRKIRGLANVA